MNFDDLKAKWDKEPDGDINLPQKTTHLRKAQHPVDTLKRNMRTELWVQIVAIIIIAFFPIIFNLHSSLVNYFYLLYAMIVVVSCYYLINFYRFYKQIHPYASDTKNNLLELYYELRLNMERYKSFGFLLLPFINIILGLMFYSDQLHKDIPVNFLSDKALYEILFIVVAEVALMMWALNIWINRFYGKYVSQIKSLLDELKED